MAPKKRGIKVRGSVLREHRIRCQLTQAQLAEVGHVTNRWVMAVENGTEIDGRQPRVSPLVLEAWANRLGIEPAELIAEQQDDPEPTDAEAVA